MNKIYLFCIGFLLLSSQASADKTIRIVSYNLENLFDCENDPKTDDDSFTPEGDHHWTYVNNTTITYPIESAYLELDDNYLNIYLNDKKFDVLKVDNGTVEVYDENNVPVKDGEFKTGYIIRITTDNNQLFYLKVK